MADAHSEIAKAARDGLLQAEAVPTMGANRGDATVRSSMSTRKQVHCLAVGTLRVHQLSLPEQPR